MSVKTKTLLTLILTSVFSALSFVLTMFNIPLPIGGMIHLGNFVCILAGLLFGPVVGGISGSLGMGLYDIVMGYNPTSYIRTFICKFVMGFVAGLIYHNYKNNKVVIKTLVSVVIAVILNIGLEFGLRTLLVGIVTNYETSFATAIAKTPSSLITGIVTIIAIMIINPPLQIAIRNHKKIKEVAK